MATAFAALAGDLSAAADLDGIAELVLGFAVTGVSCDRATIELLPTRRFAAVSLTAGPRQAPTGLTGSQNGCLEHRARSSVHAVKLVADDTVLGVIAFFAAHSEGFTATDVATARLLAGHAALAITARRTAATLAEAIDTRTVISQAQGIVMERYDLAAADAFHVLRRYSQDLNVKLRDVARDVVASRRLPDVTSRNAGRG